MELLAPVGNLDNFEAAIEAGADAVYAGAPAMNARNLARDLRFEEIAAMTAICKQQGRKLYLAANSLIREDELARVVETLTILEQIGPHGLIVQDLGLAKIIADHFPTLSLHASTLMAAHNSLAVHAFEDMGFERVVLAREMTLKEIAAVCRKTSVEIEIFIHGAMCFSYSGLCLFSSYLGGKSGLRGRCVQPCRRKYDYKTQTRGRGNKRGNKRGGKRGSRQKGARGGYLFSMNDLGGLEAVPELIRTGVASLKIEGRLRSAHYVSHVVRAYRLMIDSRPEEYERNLRAARRLGEQAMSRRTAPGYFFSPQPPEAISPHHSGNIGLHLGSLKQIRTDKEGCWGRLTIKHPLAVGDRLRIHYESSGERKGFTLKAMRLAGKQIPGAEAGAQIDCGLPGAAAASSGKRVELYKVDVKKEAKENLFSKELTRSKKQLNTKGSMRSDRLANLLAEITPRLEPHSSKRKQQGKAGPKETEGPIRYKGGRKQPEWWLKVDDVRLLLKPQLFKADRLLLKLNRKNTAQAGTLKRYLGKNIRNLIWVLPPILFESELVNVSRSIQTLVRSGFRGFQLGHISQAWLFAGQRVHLTGDYSLNLLNSQALFLLDDMEWECAQLCIESDRNLLKKMVQGVRSRPHRIKLGLTVYGAPPLFSARLSAKQFQFDKGLLSPKKESYTMVKEDGLTKVIPNRPFSLLGFKDELADIGLDYLVIDLSHNSGKKEFEEVADRLTGKGRMMKLPTFNYLGKLD
ncbi:MAG: peptidase U32 family protein [Thermodesulfobacteriota bacterium]